LTFSGINFTAGSLTFYWTFPVLRLRTTIAWKPLKRFKKNMPRLSHHESGGPCAIEADFHSPRFQPWVGAMPCESNRFNGFFEAIARLNI